MSDMKASPVAAEIHRNFNRKMAKGGEIDRILNGGEPIAKLAPESDAEIALRKRQIGLQLEEYQQAIGAAVTWHQDWKAKRPKGFRAARRRLR